MLRPLQAVVSPLLEVGLACQRAKEQATAQEKHGKAQEKRAKDASGAAALLLLKTTSFLVANTREMPLIICLLHVFGGLRVVFDHLHYTLCVAGCVTSHFPSYPCRIMGKTIFGVPCACGNPAHIKIIDLECFTPILYLCALATAMLAIMELLK